MNAIENGAFVLNVHVCEDFIDVLILTCAQSGVVWMARVSWSDHVLVKLVDAACALVLMSQ